MTKNILVTTLGSTIDYNRHNYYSYNNQEKIRYCEGISSAEAGAKYILSKIPIDKIIVLAPSSFKKKEELEEEMKLRDFCELGAAFPENYSEYKFFCYRIMQFLNNVDIEGMDLMETVTEEEQEEIRLASKEILPSADMRHLFAEFDRNYQSFETYLDALPNMDRRKRRWLKHYLFMRLDRELKMTSRGVNEDITVQFCPTIKEGEQYVRLNNLANILEYIIEDGRDEIQVYVDLQGMDLADSHTLVNVLFMLQNEKSKKVTIEEIITTSYRPALFANPIEDQKNRLELSELLSGMDAFLQYGKVDSIRKYWLGREIKDHHIDQLIYAMRMVDVGITLCSVPEMEYGIQLLREAFREKSEPTDAVESVIFNILETGIRKDYGSLLKGNDNEINVYALIKWAAKKHFYQQALTIIEAKVPYDLVRSGVFYYARSADEKQKFMEILNEAYWRTSSKDRYVFDDLEHYYIKNFRRKEAYNKRTNDVLTAYIGMRIDELFDPNSEIKAYSKANSKRPVFEQFLRAYLQIGSVRNEIAHAQFSGEAMVAEDLTFKNPKIEMMEKTIDDFTELYRQVRTGISKNDKNEWMISQEEFKEYRNSHRIQFDHRRGYGKK